MMLGAAGTLCCLTAGTVLGIYLRDRRQARVQLLNGLTDVLTGMRLLLVQERLGMGELLNECAAYAPRHPGGGSRGRAPAKHRRYPWRAIR